MHLSTKKFIYSYSINNLITTASWFYLVSSFLFMLCSIQSTSLADAVYHMDWSLLPISESKDLLMIMRRSTIPIKFTSSFLITLSLQSYSNVSSTLPNSYSVILQFFCFQILKTSYSVFNLLQQWDAHWDVHSSLIMVD